MRHARIFFIIVILFCGFEVVRLWFLSPDVMAAHFNAQGNPDRFVPKLIFFGYQAKTVLVVLVLSLVMQILPLILPMQWINMPNREYWYSPRDAKPPLIISVLLPPGFLRSFCWGTGGF